MLTYQDYKNYEGSQAEFIKKAINEYKSGEFYKTACDADMYDKQKNTTIMEFVQKLFSLNGGAVENFTASNNRIASNFFNRLNIQRCTYLLGNGINFNSDKNGSTKSKFGEKFDTIMQEAGYNALIHGVSYLFWADRLYCFKATELVPLYDEYNGSLMAAVRFWQIADNKPLSVVFYERDGYTEYAENDEKELIITKNKTTYIVKATISEAFGMEIVGEENYSALPIIPLWGSRLKQSTLVGLRAAIDSYDLIRSGFANDLTDCAQIYWILENYGGMGDQDLQRFRDRILLNHIATADTHDGGRVTPYAQDIPYQAREQYLQTIRAEIYEGFGGLDVHTIAAGATNDHIDAAYQPLDENADDFEKQIIECVQKIGDLLGIDSEKCIPIFKRNRISNQTEQADMILQAAQYLDDETVLRHLPFITVDEVEDILSRKAAEEQKQVIDMRAELEELRAKHNDVDTADTEEMINGQSA